MSAELMVDAEAWSVMMDLWLFLPFTLGFIFFRSKAGVVIEEHVMKALYGASNLSDKEAPEVDSEHFFAVRSELRQIRQEIIQERRSFAREEGNIWHEE
jgi:hypothetical protein